MKKVKQLYLVLFILLTAITALSACSSNSAGSRYSYTQPCKTTIPQKKGPLLYVACGTKASRIW